MSRASAEWTVGHVPAGSRTFVDLHNHIVPAVDDGAQSVEESFGALEEYGRAGVGHVVTTPHLGLPALPGAAALQRRLRELIRGFAKLLERRTDPGARPLLSAGQEVLAPDPAQVRRVVDDPAVGLGPTPYLLVEFGFELSGDPLGVIRAVRAAGREIVVAHPERYVYPGESGLDVARRWRDAGAFLQVNLGSLLGCYDSPERQVSELAWALLEDGAASLLASDHHCRARPQILHREVLALLERRGGGAQADLLLAKNPGRIRLGRRPADVPPLRCRAA